MSNTETQPTPLVCRGRPTPTETVTVLTPRDVPLGGPRALRVRRTLPQRKRSLIGAWCFADHYGPQDVATTGGMDVPRTRTPACRPQAGCSAARSSTATAWVRTPSSAPANSTS